jgi:hypothetical protein
MKRRSFLKSVLALAAAPLTLSAGKAVPQTKTITNDLPAQDALLPLVDAGLVSWEWYARLAKQQT